MSTHTDTGAEPYTTAQAAKILGVSDATLRRWVKSGKIEALVTVSGQYQFTDEHIAAARPRPVVHRVTRP